MFTTDTEEEARTLIALACPVNCNGEYVARELEQEQTLENLEAFGDRLERIYFQFIRKADVRDPYT